MPDLIVMYSYAKNGTAQWAGGRSGGCMTLGGSIKNRNALLIGNNSAFFGRGGAGKKVCCNNGSLDLRAEAHPVFVFAYSVLGILYHEMSNRSIGRECLGPHVRRVCVPRVRVHRFLFFSIQ
jgi:hypothetical protein